MPDPFDWQTVYPAGLLRAYEPPRQPLWRFLADRARCSPDAVVVSDGARNSTASDLWDAARAAGASFRALGASPGERVMVVLPNTVAFLTAFQGALAAGAVVVAASPHLTAAELAPMIADAGPRVVVCERERAEAVEAAVAAAGADAAVVVADESWPEASAGPASFEPADRSPSDLAVLQYTSGTTGGLKAAMMTHRNLVANALQNAMWFRWTDRDVVLGALPLCHTWGMCCVMHSSFAAGARIVLVRQFEPGAVLDAIERERVTVAYGSATMFHRLLDAATSRTAAWSASLRYVKAGAMLVGGDLPGRWAAAVPGVPMVNGYGLTEAGPEVTDNPPLACRPGSVGVPLPGTELRLGVPEDPGAEARPGDDGEVQLRGPQVMAGYWRQPEATRAAFTHDGWLRTGDLASFDAAGYLVIRDRLKDLIKYRGWSIVPGEVERALREHAAVSEACVVGVPDPRDGEVPVAFIVLRAAASAPADAEWRAHLDPRLARMKHPRRFETVPEIPKNHVGKPLRRVLRDRTSAARRAAGPDV